MHLIICQLALMVLMFIVALEHHKGDAYIKTSVAGYLEAGAAAFCFLAGAAGQSSLIWVPLIAVALCAALLTFLTERERLMTSVDR